MRSLDALADAIEAVDAGAIHVVCLPDFFLDHFVELPPWREATAAMERVHAQGGGNLQGIPQRFASGGNAANTALALARLGVKSHLVARTSPFGLETIRASLGAAGVDVARVKADGDLAVTTALEFGEGAGRRNVMLSNAGSVATFGFDDLDDNDLTLIEGSDAVLVANWSQSRHGGAGLITQIARVAEKSGTLAYVDTGDPSGRAAEVPDFVENVLTRAPIGVAAMNENELGHFTGERATDRDALLALGGRLAARVRGAIDLHTAEFAASWRAGRLEAVAPAFRVGARRATGAGDSWNAGNLLGHLADFSAEDRLVTANALAAWYVSHEEGRHPTVRELAAFVRGKTI